MNVAIAEAYVKAFFATSIGQACLAALRVFAATMVGCWVHAGMPIPPTEHQWVVWLSVAGPSSLSLVLGNYLGPWEKRYGRNKRTRV